MNYIGKILPIDGYHVTLQGTLPVDYAVSLTHLYQPLIGMDAVMLYQTLLHENTFQGEMEAQTHHTLMHYLNIPLDEMYEARLKLEGIGLLETYVDNTVDYTLYIYQLKSPFSPEQFFQDAMLSQLLYHHLGKDKYEMLRTHFGKTTNHYAAKKNVTASFADVFDIFSPSANIEPISFRRQEQGPKLDQIDFSWMEQMLKQRMIPVKRVLTKDNKKIIQQMKTLYDLQTYELEKAVLWALNEENQLDVEEFIQACHDTFKSKNQGMQIKLSKTKLDKTQSEASNANNQPLSKEEQLIRELENISPKQLLADLSSGNHASEQDMKVIRDCMVTQGLPAPVMNVLIHYVLLQSNMKLSKAYIEKIASHWSRANLKTAREAMQFAKQEKNRYNKSVGKKQNYRTSGQVSKEIVPEWFKERKNKQKEPDKNQSVIDIQKEKEEMAAFIQKYRLNQKNNQFQG